jgi:hypothetical protein
MARPSFSASSQQPVAHHALFTFDDYRSDTGQPALSATINIQDLGRFWAEDKRQAGGYEGNWSSVRRHYRNPFGISNITNADEAMAAMKNFEFPVDIKVEARRLSAQLYDLFEQVTKFTREYDHISGRLDRRKLTKLARHTIAGTYDVNQVRPYRRFVPTPSKIPTIAIITSGGNAEMWGDKDYIPNVIKLTLGVQWACEAANLPTYAALTKENIVLDPNSHYKDAVLGILLAEPDRTYSPRHYGIALHRDLWRHGQMTCQAADYEANVMFQSLRNPREPSRKYDQGRATRRTIGALWPSVNGGNGVQWARDHLGADIVLAIGNITDGEKADVHLKTAFSTKQAVDNIVWQMNQ